MFENPFDKYKNMKLTKKQIAGYCAGMFVIEFVCEAIHIPFHKFILHRITPQDVFGTYEEIKDQLNQSQPH